MTFEDALTLRKARQDECKRELQKLTDEQLDELDFGSHEHWSSGRHAEFLHAEAVRRGWLLGPA